MSDRSPRCRRARHRTNAHEGRLSSDATCSNETVAGWLAPVLLGVAGLGASGCVTVSPYQRGRLAQPDMAIDRPADLVAGQDHADEYRESSVGGWGGGGGGCGCN